MGVLTQIEEELSAPAETRSSSGRNDPDGALRLPETVDEATASRGDPHKQDVLSGSPSSTS